MAVYEKENEISITSGDDNLCWTIPNAKFTDSDGRDFTAESLTLNVDSMYNTFISYLVYITMEDGCEFTLQGKDGNSDGWECTLPPGFKLTCPHGHSFEVI